MIKVSLTTSSFIFRMSLTEPSFIFIYFFLCVGDSQIYMHQNKMTDDPRTCSRVHCRFDWSQIGTLLLTLVSTFHTVLNLTCDFFSYLISKVQGVAFLAHLILPFSIISRIVYQDNVHQQSSYAKLGDRSE